MPAIPYRLYFALASALAILLAASGMIGCSATAHSTSHPSTAVSDSEKFAQDRKAILGMAGEYDVTFDFQETLAVRDGYELKKPYLEHASEMVIVAEDTGEHIALQHLLVVNRGGETHVVKHWRQDWQYQSTRGYDFKGKNLWVPMTFSAEQSKGAWVQSVYQVDDSPRYWGIARWEHRDGVSTWSAATNRPLPRREFSKRSDYQVLGAVNTHVVTEAGWVHYQHNQKIDKQREDAPIIALERGVNTYGKTNKTDFSKAKDYWQNTRNYWSEVRAAWAEVYAQREPLKIKSKWKGEKMYSHIFDLADDYWGEDDLSTARAKIDEVIQAYTRPEQVAKP